jgi:hypothetical protein
MSQTVAALGAAGVGRLAESQLRKQDDLFHASSA